MKRPLNHEEVLAFGLMMIKLGSCLTCDLDSYRASLGCCTCARRSISGFKGDDEELLGRYERALNDVQSYLSKGKIPQPMTLLLQEKTKTPGR
ncbi:MAG: hypothetical protein JXB35_07250 [Anaerolineae bacterium]|nr:hypothetical protein [Anaerolineae bacterium]